MAGIRTLDMDLLDDLFGMRGGYVLDFTDRTFGEFFLTEVKRDIDAPKWRVNGTSKAKRLRYFLQNVDGPTAVRTLTALWEYRETKRRRAGQPETIPNAEAEFWEIIGRLGGNKPATTTATPPPEVLPGPDPDALKQLGVEWVELSKLPAQPRGFAFEKFLKTLFDLYGLDPRSSFRLRGEQIDGSFELGGSTYLLEARWREAVADAAALRAFHGKVDEKADWSRGLFISMNGFSEDGLHAFGRAKRLICMDGYDLYEVLSQGIAFDEVIRRKARRAAETGEPFVRVRELF